MYFKYRLVVPRWNRIDERINKNDIKILTVYQTLEKNLGQRSNRAMKGQISHFGVS